MKLPRYLGAIAAILGLAVKAHAAPGDPPSHISAFTKAFEPGFAVETSDKLDDGTVRVETVTFKAIEIGKLIIKSGRICAADPFVSLGDMKPFTQEIPSGEFAVRLAVGFHPAGEVKDNRVSFARVDFSGEPAVRWSLAVVEGQKLTDLKEGEIFGYGVDAGTGSFFDPLAGTAAKALLAANPDASEAWQTEGEAKGPKIVGPYSFVLMQPMGDTNVAMFHSGWGDGFYSSWFGFDKDGKVAALVTDFNTIDWATSKW